MSLFRRIAVLFLLIAGVIALIPATTVQAAPADDEVRFLNDINGLRASKGLAGFQRNASLDAMAVAWANQMVANGKISHNPNLAKQAPGGWQKLGENVGVGGDEPSLHNAFVNSPGHYANLVDGGFNQIGIAVVAANGRIWTVHVFMTSPIKNAAPVESEASKYLRTLSDRLPAAANLRTLRARTAVGA